MAEQPFPHVPKALLDELIRQFPNRCATPTDRMREVWMQAGEQRLIRKLKHHFTQQNKLGHETEDEL